MPPFEDSSRKRLRTFSPCFFFSNYSALSELLAKCLSSPNDSIGDPWLKIWIPDYTLGNDNFFYCAE